MAKRERIPLREITIELESMNKNMLLLTKVGITKISLDVLAACIEDSPVDQGTLKREWKIEDGPVGGNVIVRKVVTNSMPYFPTIELGSKVGELPWKKAGPRTVEKDGRVFSSQAVGGVMQPILDSEYPGQAAKELADFVAGGL